MSTATLSDIVAAPVSAAIPKKGFWTRVLDAIIAARTEQAEREILKYVNRPGRYPLG